jgi:hypothetical protein
MTASPTPCVCVLTGHPPPRQAHPRASDPCPPHLLLPQHHVWQDGFTGLYLASQNGHREVVRLLLDSKADANLADKVHPFSLPADWLSTHINTSAYISIFQWQESQCH